VTVRSVVATMINSPIHVESNGTPDAVAARR
jgi:hypothetical protein